MNIGNRCYVGDNSKKRQGRIVAFKAREVQVSPYAHQAELHEAATKILTKRGADEFECLDDAVEQCREHFAALAKLIKEKK
jgi:hypothetical protein